MVQIEDNFLKLITNFDLSALNSSVNVVYGIANDFIIRYVNQAWFDFAKSNNGLAILSGQWGIGSLILEAMPDQIKPYYKSHYLNSLETNTVWQSEYECSSDQVYRLMHQTVYPLQGQGLLIENSIRIEKPCSLLKNQNQSFEQSHYRDEFQTIAQCCHCRKFKNRNTGAWDWISPWLNSSPSHVSHVLCNNCLEFYYPQSPA